MTSKILPEMNSIGFTNIEHTSALSIFGSFVLLYKKF